MQLVKVLDYKEDSMPQFLMKDMERLISYFLEKNLKRIELNFFAPYYGYKNVQDHKNEEKLKDFSKVSNEQSLIMEQVLNEFVSSFYIKLEAMTKEERQRSTIRWWSMYQPKIFSDYYSELKLKVLDDIRERIEASEEDQIMVIFVIDSKYRNDYLFQEKLPFANYIFFNF